MSGIRRLLWPAITGAESIGASGVVLTSSSLWVETPVSTGCNEATGYYEFRNDGTLWRRGVMGSTGCVSFNDPVSGQWGNYVTPSDYEIRAVLVSGDTLNYTNAAMSTWLSLGTTRYWGYQTITGPDRVGTFDVEIRRVSDQVVVASATYTINTFVNND